MFNIGLAELLLILVLAVVLVGPQDLPKVTRWLARAFRSMRNTLKEFTASLNIDEEIKDVKETGNMLRETIRDINPVADLTDELQMVKKETQTGIKLFTDLPGAIKKEAMGLGAAQEKEPVSDGEKRIH